MAEEATQETEKKETETQEQELHEFVYNGEVVKLTKEQLQKAVYLGLGKAQEIAEGNNKKEEKKEEKVEDKKEAGDDLKAEITKLREEIKAKEDSREKMNEFNRELQTIGQLLKVNKVDPDFMEDLTLKIITTNNDAKAKNLPVSVTDIANKIIEKHNKRMERYQPRIDPDAKKKDKEDTERISGGGRSAGQEKPKPLGRSAFRNGELSKRVGEKISKLLERATE